MKQKDKELLLKDLCARIPYNTIVHLDLDGGQKWQVDAHISKDIDDIFYLLETQPERVKPYLRPMSSMTEEECMELSKIRPFDDDVEAWKYIKTPVPLKIANIKHFDFFHSHHLDWRGLIEKGLAIEALEGMYKIN